MSRLLNADEGFLFEKAEDGERGLATYTEKKLDGNVLMSRTSDGSLSAFVWDVEQLLWIKRNEEATMKGFFDQELGPALKLLKHRLELLKTSDAPLKYELSIVKGAVEKSNTKSHMKAIFSMATSSISSQGKLDMYSDVLPLANGKKVSLRTGEITTRTKTDLWSFHTLANGEEPSEQARADALLFHQNMCILPDGLVDQGKLDYLQILCGYSMTFETTDKALYFLVGISDSGKSELFRQMLLILGKRVGSCQPDIFIEVSKGSTHQTYLVSLLDKSMVFCQELPKGRQLNSDVVKRLSGNDEFSFRRCGAKGAPEKFVNKAKMFVGSQNMPQFDGGDTGMVTRCRKIPFNRDLVHLPPAEREANMKLLNRLNTQDGINGLFAFWLEGAKRYYQNLESNIMRIAPPDCVMEENADFLGESDSFQRFITECCDVWTAASPEGRDNFKYERRELQNAYRTYATKMSYNKEVILDTAGVSSRMRLQFPGQKAQGAYIGVRKKMVDESSVAQITL